MEKRIRKWVVLAEDGLHDVLGRETDPTEDEIVGAERVLANKGMGGWLAVAEGSFHEPGHPPSLMLVRELGGSLVSFDEAVLEFRRLRNAANGDGPGVCPDH